MSEIFMGRVVKRNSPATVSGQSAASMPLDYGKGSRDMSAKIQADLARAQREGEKLVGGY